MPRATLVMKHGVAPFLEVVVGMLAIDVCRPESQAHLHCRCQMRLARPRSANPVKGRMQRSGNDVRIWASRWDEPLQDHELAIYVARGQGYAEVRQALARSLNAEVRSDMHGGIELQHVCASHAVGIRSPAAALGLRRSTRG